MRRALLIPFVLALALAGACNQADTTAAGDDARAKSAAAAKNLTPEDFGELGAEMKNNPDLAERILSERGLDQQTFEKEIRKISEDPEASKRYAAAYKEASA